MAYMATMIVSTYRPAPPCPPAIKPPPSDRELQRCLTFANEKLTKGCVADALHIIERIVSCHQHPAFMHARRVLAEAYMRQGDLVGCARILAGLPEIAPVLVVRAELKLTSGDLHGAWQDCCFALGGERGVLSRLDRLQATVVCGCIHAAFGNHHAALADLSAAVASLADGAGGCEQAECLLARARTCRSRVMLCLGDCVGAEADVSAVLASAPGDPGVRALLAEVLHAKGESSRAVAELDRAIGTGGDRWQAAWRLRALSLRADAHLRLGDLSAALSDADAVLADANVGNLSTAWELQERAQCVRSVRELRAAVLARFQDDPRRAAKDLGALIGLRPLDASLRIQRVLACDAIADYDEALRELEAVRSMVGSVRQWVTAVFARAMLLLRLGCQDVRALEALIASDIWRRHLLY